MLWRLEDVTALYMRYASGLRQGSRLVMLDRGPLDNQHLSLALTMLEPLDGAQTGAHLDETFGCFVDESLGFLETAVKAGGISALVVTLLLAGRLVDGRDRVLSLALI